ncbi:hypothetical protein QVN03_08710 [Raoultella terrigena]|uniref:hypothetical protein n=1 Tax=Raoultella terrigena TaxID=577 RepID=UPI0025AFBC71|nr:hypothetical protein [Raoultella terrigena]WJV40591.1 hypothetical protein QVN03_08710 [Raoultella terrigena]
MKFRFTPIVLLLSFYITDCFSSDFFLGINAHILHDSKSDILKTIKMSSDIGVKSIRIDCPWSEVEYQKNKYIIPEKWDFAVNEMISKGIEPLIILEYGNKFYNNGDKPVDDNSRAAFGKYVDVLSKHFKNRVKLYEVWNEWDSNLGKTTPGNVESYKKLVNVVYPILKNNDANTTVITSAFSSGAFDKSTGIGKDDFMRDYMSPDIAGLTDGLAIHPYTTYKPKPYNKYITFQRDISYSLNLLRSLSTFKSKSIYITEIGWSTVKGDRDGVSEEEQCNYILQSIDDAKKIGIKALYIYDFKDDGIVQSAGVHFGLLKYDWSPKKSYNCLLDKYKTGKAPW